MFCDDDCEVGGMRNRIPPGSAEQRPGFGGQTWEGTRGRAEEEAGSGSELEDDGPTLRTAVLYARAPVPFPTAETDGGDKDRDYYYGCQWRTLSVPVKTVPKQVRLSENYGS